MEREEALAKLKAGLTSGDIPERDIEFVTSLVGRSSNGLSDKQWLWVVKLAKKFAGEELRVGDLSGVYAMFAKAAARLRYPKVHLATDKKRQVRLYVSSARSRVPGVVNVIDPGDGTWYGRVYPDGRWEQGNATPAATEDVAQLLNTLGAAPEETAAKYGKVTGCCCFCSRSLEDERSLHVGYGKTCANNYGLHWGSK